MKDLKIGQWAAGLGGGLAAALAVPLYLRYRGDLRAARERVAAAGSQVIETACGRIEYATRGEGYPVLVVHGIFGGFDQGIVDGGDTLGEGYRAIVPSRFGYLRTPMPEAASPASQADAYACLLDHVGIERVAVMAYSAGSTSAIQFVLRHPDRVSALVLISPNAPGVEPVPPPEAVMRLLFRSDIVFWLAITYFPSLLRLPMGVPEGFVLTPEYRAEVAKMLQTILPATARAEGFLFDMFVSNPDINTGYPFARCSVPALIIAARDDPMAPYANACSLAEQLPGARLLTIEQGGHLMLGQREQTRTAIMAFLEEHIVTPAQARSGLPATADR